MRLWSLHPKHLDARGLVAAWREGLLAQKVLQGRTRGYRHHPQLKRFLESSSPRELIGVFLREIAEEGARRGYAFDVSKIATRRKSARQKIAVTRGQVLYEYALLKKKLAQRDRRKLYELHHEKQFTVNRAFRITSGDVAEWEKVIKALIRQRPAKPEV